MLRTPFGTSTGTSSTANVRNKSGNRQSPPPSKYPRSPVPHATPAVLGEDAADSAHSSCTAAPASTEEPNALSPDAKLPNAQKGPRRVERGSSLKSNSYSWRSNNGPSTPMATRSSGALADKNGVQLSPSPNDSFSSTASSTGGKKRRGIEVSYSSTLLFVWATLLALISYHNRFSLQAASILILCTVALTSEHGESRLLWPLVFLSERCLDHAQHLGHSPIEFYSSTLLSYLTLVACKAERRGESARDRNVLLETLLYGMVGLAVVFSIVKDNTICFAALAFVGTGYVFFLKLLPHVGDNEAVLVSTLVGFYICDLCVNNNLSVDGGRETILKFNAPGYITSYTHIASRGMVLGTIYMMACTSVASKYCLVPTNKNSKSSERHISRKRITLAFCVSFAVVALIMFTAVSYQFRENVVLWLYAYIVSSKFRLWTLIGWVTCIPAAVFCVDAFTRTLRQTVRRKLFHFIAVIAFTPAAMIDPAFFAFAVSTATSLSATIEVARHYDVMGSRVVTKFVSHHIDQRDSLTGAVRTHIYLIFGLGVSLILQYRHQRAPSEHSVPAIMELSINIIPGIISLGIVDAAAAIIGSSFLFTYRRALGRYLKNKLFTERANTSITHKTTTGTIGGLIAGLLFWSFILIVAEVPFVGPTLYSFTMIVVCSLTECFMDGIDNLQMPLVVLGAVNSLFSLLVPVPELWTNPAIRRPNPTTASSLASALTSPWKNWPPVPDKVKSLISS